MSRRAPASSATPRSRRRAAAGPQRPAYLKSPAPGTTLALVAGELRKDGPLAKAVAGHGSVLLWDVTAKGVPRWIGEQFKLHGATADASACRLMAELVGDDLYELASE